MGEMNVTTFTSLANPKIYIIIPDHAVGAGLPVGQEEDLGTRLA